MNSSYRWFLVAALVVGCGAGSNTPKKDNECTGGIGAGLTCDHYCTTFMRVCGPMPATKDSYSDKAECMTKCQPLTQDALCCRASHADFAAIANPDVHCPHAAAQTLCE